MLQRAVMIRREIHLKKKKNCDRRGKESFYNLLSSKKDGQSSTLMQKSFQIL